MNSKGLDDLTPLLADQTDSNDCFRLWALNFPMSSLQRPKHYCCTSFFHPQNSPRGWFKCSRLQIHNHKSDWRWLAGPADLVEEEQVVEPAVLAVLVQSILARTHRTVPVLPNCDQRELREDWGSQIQLLLKTVQMHSSASIQTGNYFCNPLSHHYHALKSTQVYSFTIMRKLKAS